MGSDRGPREVIAGALRAAETTGCNVVIVGTEEVVAEVPEQRGVTVSVAQEVIEMSEDPRYAIRVKRRSSALVAAELVRDGSADALVTAGSTGVAVLASQFRIGRVAGVIHPALASLVGRPGRPPAVLLDTGASMSAEPEWLAQFAVMGQIYSRARFGVETPSVGLLAIGREEAKVRALEIAGVGALVDLPGFVGLVEGHDLGRDVDVVVTDGFTGNVALKALEAGVQHGIRAAASAVGGIGNGPEFSLALARHFAMEGWEMGAALLGVHGVTLICHGAATAAAVADAVRAARTCVEHDFVGLTAATIASMSR